ncbi:MAG TPA: tripartite tricarboxylate transporter TctB family protein [Burkholderiaceae bacterium]|nr:tripartite tricarboxylate transporter TctB family protein [Burkholderiaceae bacterium]
MQTDVDAGPTEAGIATWLVELLVALALLLLGAIVAWKSWQLGAVWRDDGPGAGYFPFYIAVLVCVSSAVVGARALTGGRDRSVFVTFEQLRRVLTVLLPTLAFVVVTQFLGLYVGSLLFITGFMVWVGHYRWGRSLAIGFAVAALAFLLFEVWFKVPLFKGTLDPLRFLPY